LQALIDSYSNYVVEICSNCDDVIR